MTVASYKTIGFIAYVFPIIQSVIIRCMCVWIIYEPVTSFLAAHSSILAWRVPGTEEPSGLPSLGLHRVGHDRSYLAAAFKLHISWNNCHLINNCIHQVIMKNNETKQDLVGPSWLQKPFHVPCFLSVGKRLQPPRPSLNSKGQMQLLIREGR